ncbi:glycoside hydrolase [Miniimonas arenae]|uniref:Glycoside hydrolase n=1 Tax=Miniimonas arenae TaxID=676201 RepID=A0A5C5BBL8_9MICO|nr:glycoside hydrolase family 31 protein [Miniimonas arenae]TNU73375.1 glycoside hydrolase [Miniimonas arenae]
MVAMSDGRPAPAHPDAVVTGRTYRFTALTSRLIRMEWHPDGVFVDRPTQAVVSRAFDPPWLDVDDDGERLSIRTEHVQLVYDKERFSTAGLSVALHRGAPDAHYATWRYGQEIPGTLPLRGNLGGTARTLDEVDGACPLEPGVLAAHGFTVLDDSGSVLMSQDGWIEPRTGGGLDLYLFAYGRDFRAALTDYHRLTGPVPLVPRFTLGNWWSRYWPYSEPEYVALMDDFRDRGLPFSVAVIDMDWHVVDVDPELGTGWTGYTWNRDLFPDPARFLGALHERGLAVTLNVHPADGIRRHEEAYPAVARALGLDPESGVPVPFDITDRAFVDAYFTHVHHPREAEGVDFWWLDWQSGGVTNIPGLDPLWMLNHLHFTDSGRSTPQHPEGRRPLTFSRYGGLGSHRYPVGFSGDTITTWASLAFQPYFTATAANIGYTWWSHDIGGHMFGVRDVELAVRWYQFGVFSPINRLHSSASAFNTKEPWRFGPRAEAVMSRFLRLRHLLVPALYSAAWSAHTDGVAIVRPMYHDAPNVGAALEARDQYLLGPDLLVAPVITPADPSAHLAATGVWLPDGEWTDLFTGATYAGGRRVTMHRGLDTIPVLARTGTVLPLAADPLAPVDRNPEALVVRVFPGRVGTSGRGTFVLVEDDGAGSPTADDRQQTRFDLAWETVDDALDVTLSIPAPTGPGVLTRRRITVDLVGPAGADAVELARAGGERIDGPLEGTGSVVGGGAAVGAPASLAAEDPTAILGPALRLDLGELDLGDGVRLHVRGARPRRNSLADDAFALLDAAEIPFHAKERAWSATQRLSGVPLVEELSTVPDLPDVLRAAIVELASVHAAHAD